MTLFSGGTARWFLALFVVASPVAAQATPRQQLPPAPAFSVRPITGSVTVDGVLDEADWADAAPIRLSWEIAPGDNVAPPVETTCRILFDTAMLYFGCRAIDPDPGAIRAHLAERDDRVRMVQDDHIVFLLDTFNDERRGFEFRVNAAGVQEDAILSRAEGIEDFSWNAVWYSEVNRTDTGYDVEVGIPLSSLRFPETAGPQTWGLIIDRSYPRNVRHRMRSAPTDRNTTCLLCSANKITGFQGIEPGSSLEAIPTLTARRDEARTPFPGGVLAPTTESSVADIEPDIGLDMRWGITSSMSLNGTLNPDFSQVEADVAQLAENQRFALFFPETRPFFLEGADFFATPIQAVFTRSVADPDWGLKLTGKEGSNAVGLFAARDATTNFIFPANQGTETGIVDLPSDNVVARYRRDVGASSYVGALYTGRIGDDYSNHVFGLDVFHRLSPSNSIRGQYLRSRTSYPDDLAAAFSQPSGEFDGAGFWAEFAHFSRNWVASTRYSDLAPELRADAGFVPRVDARIADGSFGRVFRGAPGGWFTRIQTAATFSRTTDQEGTLTDQSIGARLTYEGPSQSTVIVSPSRRKLLFGGIEHVLNRIEGSAEVQASGSATLGVDVRTGDFVDFSNNRKSFGLALTPKAQLYLGRSVALRLSHTHQRLRFDGSAVYTANLTESRILYHFNVRTFVRAIVQYRRIERNAAAYLRPVTPLSKKLFTQFLFSYKVNPQTALFVGYSDGHEGSDVFDLQRKGRTLFFKVGYAIHP